MPGFDLGDMQIEEFRAAAHRAVDWMTEYLDTVDTRPVLPRTAPGDVRRALPPVPPEDGESFDTILDDIERLIVPATTQWNSPGFMAYFASSAPAAGVLGEMLASAFNVNAMLWRTSPAATELEQVAVDWLRQLLGLPQPMFGVINDTASLSTLHALAAARESLADLHIREDGMSGRDGLPLLRVYTSEEAHSSVEKACLVLGLGRRSVRRISVDAELRLDTVALLHAIEQDLRDGVRPMAVVATVGTTSTTSIDPVPAIAAICAAHGVWLHVDAAYGGAAGVAPELRWVLDGAEAADSLVVNPHKWLFTPLDCSVLWTRRPGVLRDAFSLVPEYLRTQSDGDEDAPNFMNYGVALGRRFRALKLWMVIRRFGAEGLAQRVRLHCEMARDLASRVESSSEFELLAPVPLSVVCLCAHPADVADEQALDALNERLLQRINAQGGFFLSHTRVRDRFAIHVAFGHVRARAEQVGDLWSQLQEALHAETASP